MSESMWIDLGDYAEEKRRQEAVANKYRSMTRGGAKPVTVSKQPIYRAPAYTGTAAPRFYVPRTPGGNVTSELKYFDSTRVAAAIQAANTNGTNCLLDPTPQNTLFYPVQGNDIVNREARKVWVKHVRIKGFISIPAQSGQTTGDIGLIIRLALVMDKQTNGSQCTSEQIFLDAVSSTEQINAFINTAYFGRFMVLKDKYITYQPNNLTAAPQNQNLTTGDFTITLLQQGGIIRFKINKTFANKGMCVNYNTGNAGTVADTVDNSFHLYAATSVTGINGLSPTLTYKCRTTFSD